MQKTAVNSRVMAPNVKRGVAVMAAVADIVLDISICNSSSRRFYIRNNSCYSGSWNRICFDSNSHWLRTCSLHYCWRWLRRQWWRWQQWRWIQRLTIQLTHYRVFSHLPGLTPRYCSPPLYIYWVHTAHGDVIYLQALDFVINRFFMKLFKTSSIDTY